MKTKVNIVFEGKVGSLGAKLMVNTATLLYVIFL